MGSNQIPRLHERLKIIKNDNKNMTRYEFHISLSMKCC